MAITPRSRSAALSCASLLQAPRSLNEAVNCRFSNLRNTCAPVSSVRVREATQGVRSSWLCKRAAAASICCSSIIGALSRAGLVPARA
jgi:hypothetical protein